VLKGDNRKYAIKIVIKHICGTMIEKGGRIYDTNQVHEHQCTELN
jgi:hypothetical protein